MWLRQSVTQWTNAERKPWGTHQFAQPSPWMEHQTHSETQIIAQPLTEVEKEIQCKCLKAMWWVNPILKGQTQAGFSILQADNPFTCGSTSPGENSFLLVGHKTQRESGPGGLDLPIRYACYTWYFVFHFFLCFSFTLTVNPLQMLSHYNMSCQSRIITKGLKLFAH